MFTGDTINSLSGLPVWKRFATRLSAIAPTVAVRGNWDVWYWGDVDLFGGTGIHELANSALVMSLRGETAFSITAVADGDAQHLDLWASIVGARPREVGDIDLTIPVVDAGDGEFASFSDGRHERAWELRAVTDEVR